MTNSSIIYKIIYNKVYLPLSYKLYCWYSPLKILKMLMQSQYWTQEQFYEYYENRLRKLGKVLHKNKYYANYNFKSNLSLNRINKLRELSKEEIRKNIHLLKRKRNLRLYKMSTSGSTGFPLSIYLNPLAVAYREAGRLRFKKWWGIDFSAKWVFLWGRSRNEKPKKIMTIFRKLNPFSGLGLKLSVFDLNDRTIFKYYDLILKHKPQYIKGYKSALFQFSKLLQKHNLNGKVLCLKLAISTSEMLMPGERKVIEQVLGCRVANEYGAVEAGLFAYECPDGGMHIFEESVLIHTNNMSEIVSTELFNYSTPMLNYKTGDLIKISKKKCSCGRTLRLIEEVMGRVDDTIIKPNGEELNHLYFYYLFKDAEKEGFDRFISKYKVIQEDFTFTVFLEKDIDYDSNILEYINNRMTDDIGNEIKINFEIVENIPLDKSGKLRFFINANKH